MHRYTAPLQDMFTSSRLMILDFSQTPANTPNIENIRNYFEHCASVGINPRLPENRQVFNEQMLQASGARYLVSRYAENRAAMLAGSTIADEGRTLHLGVDVFAKHLEPVFAPCDGTIVRVGQEPESHSFGYYLFFKPDVADEPYMFFGHLAADLPELGRVASGQQIARLGDYKDNENGGWSRHLHLQLFTDLPKPDMPLVGYASAATIQTATQMYPDPFTLFPDWQLR